MILDEALQLFKRGRTREALVAALAAYEQNEGSLHLLNLIAESYSALGEHESAVIFHQRAVAAAPNDAASRRRLAQAEAAAGYATQAVKSYGYAIQLDPGNPRAHNNLGRVLEQLGDRQGAQTCYRAALASDDTYAIAHNNLGNVMAADGLPLAALDCYRRAIQLRSDFGEAWHNSAKTLLALQRPADALASCERALLLMPTLAEAWYVYGEVLQVMQRSADAVTACERAIALRGSYPQAMFARANLLRISGERRLAVDGFRDAATTDPNFDAAHLAAVIAEIPVLPLSMQETSESRDALGEGIDVLAASLKKVPCADPAAMVGAVQPFFLAYQERDNRALLSAHGDLCSGEMARWGQAACLDRCVRARGGSRINVAIVSAQIAAHSVYDAITRGWVQRLNRERFAVDVFHLGLKSDTDTQEVISLTDHFIQGPRTLQQWFTAIGEHAPDVILYPEIGMDQLTLQLASLRLAPVQAVAWGHPITSGLPTIDYFISAQAFEPADADTHYRETLVVLPNLGVYLEPPAPPIATCDTGTNAPGFVGRRETGPHTNFICPGTPFKYSPEYDDVLVQIAKRVGHCRFHFFSYKDGILSTRLLHRLGLAFAAANLDSAQFLVLHPWASTDEFHRALLSADVCLDTLGFSGFNTVMHALQCGVPTVTYRGRFLRGRLGSGILEQMALNELVADTHDDYVDIAVSLAQDEDARSRISARLRQAVPALYRDQSAIDALETFLTTACERQAALPDSHH